MRLQYWAAILPTCKRWVLWQWLDWVDNDGSWVQQFRHSSVPKVGTCSVLRPAAPLLSARMQYYNPTKMNKKADLKAKEEQLRAMQERHGVDGEQHAKGK